VHEAMHLVATCIQNTTMQVIWWVLCASCTDPKLRAKWKAPVYFYG